MELGSELDLPALLRRLADDVEAGRCGHAEVMAANVNFGSFKKSTPHLHVEVKLTVPDDHIGLDDTWYEAGWRSDMPPSLGMPVGPLRMCAVEYR